MNIRLDYTVKKDLAEIISECSYAFEKWDFWE
jgi:hypothetical protein